MFLENDPVTKSNSCFELHKAAGDRLKTREDMKASANKIFSSLGI
jgi:hypothetical protein